MSTNIFSVELPNGRLSVGMAKRRSTLSAKAGARLKALRVQFGLTQKEVAALVHVEQQEVSRLEAGLVVNVNLDLLDAIARIYQYTAADVLREILPDPSLTPVERDVLARLRVMGDRDRASMEWLILQRGPSRRTEESASGAPIPRAKAKRAPRKKDKDERT